MFLVLLNSNSRSVSVCACACACVWQALTSAQIQEALELDKITTHHWRIQGCSAVTGENLLEGMDWVVDDIASRIYMME